MTASPSTLDMIPRLRRLSLVLLGDIDRGDELVEQALMRGLVTPPTNLGFQAENAASLRVQLYRILWTVLLQEYPGLDARERSAAQEAPAPEASRQGPFEEILGAGLALMPVELRMTLALVVIEGLAYDEVALVTNVDRATVRGRLLRARTILHHYTQGNSADLGGVSHEQVAHAAGN